MAYKIAVASSDGSLVDVHFGAAGAFLIYEVADDGSFSLAEKRACPPEGEGTAVPCSGQPAGLDDFPGCGNACATCPADACGGNAGANGHACGQGGAASAKVQLVSDCRCVVAAKIGFNVTKQLEKKAISGFDVDCTVQEALTKITKYFYSVDNHVPLARR